MLTTWGEFQGKPREIWREALLPAGRDGEGTGFVYLLALWGPDIEITVQALHCHVFFVNVWAAGCVLLKQQHLVHLPCLALVNPEKRHYFPVCSSEMT